MKLISGLKRSLYWGCIQADPKANVWQQQWSWSAGWNEAYIEAASRLIRKSMCGQQQWTDQRAEMRLILRLHRGWSESQCVAAVVKLISGLKRGLYWGCIEADLKVNVWQRQCNWSADWSEAYIEAASRLIRQSMCGSSSVADKRAEAWPILRLHRGWSESQCVAAAEKLISGLKWGLYWGCIAADPTVNVWQQQWSW